MSTWLEHLGLFARAPDARPLSEIAADIDAELEFHVEESARELSARGMSWEDAHAEALRRFGDYGRIRRECARTQMGERIVMQRIQVVLTSVLIVAVGLLLWSNHEARAAMNAERAASTALLARVEAQLQSQFGGRAPIGDEAQRRGAPPSTSATPVEPGEYVGADGAKLSLGSAATSWLASFAERNESWRHGLDVANRLAKLPGTQGVEILTPIYSSLATPHREQLFKPFVFDGGHPLAVEVLALGMRDDTTSVRERAALYLETYAFRNLLYGDGAAEEWLAEWRDRPVADVLRANATAWAREYGNVIASYRQIPSASADTWLAVVDHVRPENFARAGVDLGAILREHGVDRATDEQFEELTPSERRHAEIVRSWCRSK